MAKIFVTGSAGFIGGYLVQELLSQGHQVVGIDNYSKYGKVSREQDRHPDYSLIDGDVKKLDLWKQQLAECDYLVALAAKIGGISYFHTYAYDLLAENERIMAATFDAAIEAFKAGKLKKIIVASSSMVFESTTVLPTPETAVADSPPPKSTYGFQKLACEYFAKGAHQQYGLPFTIVRPFNCVGIGEARTQSGVEIESGNLKLALSHVVPDLVLKTLKGQKPLHILGEGNQIRHYTYGGDLAKGIATAIFHPAAENNDFNLSTDQATTVLELAKLIWQKINGDQPFNYVSDPPFEHDVQKRIPDTTKAKQVLGFEAKTSLSEMIDEVIPWIKTQLEQGTI